MTGRQSGLIVFKVETALIKKRHLPFVSVYFVLFSTWSIFTTEQFVNVASSFCFEHDVFCYTSIGMLHLLLPCVKNVIDFKYNLIDLIRS